MKRVEGFLPILGFGAGRVASLSGKRERAKRCISKMTAARDERLTSFPPTAILGRKEEERERERKSEKRRRRAEFAVRATERERTVGTRAERQASLRRIRRCACLCGLPVE